MKGIVISPKGEICVRDYGLPLYKTVGKTVGGYIEIVHPRRLEWPYCMIVDEELLLKNQFVLNPVGCWLYQTDVHGSPICGTIVIMKNGYNADGEPDIVGLTCEEISYIGGKLMKQFNLNGDIENVRAD